ncbi:MAG: MFS transporter [Aliidongia sp.]
MSLAVTTYILALAMFIPVSGWFSDRFGSRRIFTLALLVFTVGSVIVRPGDQLPDADRDAGAAGFRRRHE